MTSLELSLIDRAIQIQRVSIEEQLTRLRFAETQAELDAHRRLAADLIRAMTHLGILPIAPIEGSTSLNRQEGPPGREKAVDSELSKPPITAEPVRSPLDLAAASCGDKMPHRAGQPCKPTAGAVSDLPVSESQRQLLRSQASSLVSPLNGPQIPVSGVSGGKMAQQPSGRRADNGGGQFNQS